MRNFTATCIYLGVLAATANALMVACSDAQVHPGDRSGTLSLTLRTTAPSGVDYRLRNGTFNITGHSSAVVRTEDDPDAESLQVPLTVGNYFVTLASDWYLEREAGNGMFERIDATLLSENPQFFEIVDRQTTAVRFRFKVAGEVVELEGTLSIVIDVEERNEPRCGSIGDVAQPIFTELGGLGPTGDNTWPTAVSDDGRTVIGVSRVTPAEPHAFRWTEADGMVDQATAGTVLIDSLAINCDASVMVFTSASSQRMVWTQSEGLRPLLGCQGLPLVGIEGMNQTGDVLVGECQHPDPSFATFPARWLDFEQPGMPLPGLTGWATDISADGKVFAGITQDFLVFRWSEGHGTELISAPDVFGQRLSGDGRCVFTTDFPDSDRPFRWCEGEITPIPVPPGSQTGPFFANYDGSLAIVGQGQDYWVWHEGDEAATLLLDALAESGVDLKGWDTLSVSDMTPDGRVLVGVARHSLDPTHTAAFRLVMPPW